MTTIPSHGAVVDADEMLVGVRYMAGDTGFDWWRAGASHGGRATIVYEGPIEPGEVSPTAIAGPIYMRRAPYGWWAECAACECASKSYKIRSTAILAWARAHTCGDGNHVLSGRTHR